MIKDKNFVGLGIQMSASVIRYQVVKKKKKIITLCKLL